MTPENLIEINFQFKIIALRPNGITDRKNILKLIFHFVADTDADKNSF